MKLLRLLAGIAVFAWASSVRSENLILNGDFEQPLNKECRIDNTVGGHTALTYFTEDLTWNKCVKFELKSILEKDGREFVHAGIAIGGEKTGFPVIPGRRYKFSFELKGTASKVGVRAWQWSGDDLWKGRKTLKTSLNTIVISNEWQQFSGTFVPGAEAKTVALNIFFWWDTKHGPMKYKSGDYVLIDKIHVELMPDPLQAVKSPVSNAVKPVSVKNAVSTSCDDSINIDGKLDEQVWNKARKYSGFNPLRASDKAVEDTEFMVLDGKDAFYVGIINHEPLADKIKASVSVNGSKIWKDDVTEVFFGPAVPDRKFSQFAVSAGGGRFFGNGNTELPDKYDAWQARTSIGEKSWTLEMKIPYALLGFKNTPQLGEFIAFNVARQRTPASAASSWNRLDGNFHDIKNFGKLVIASIPAFAAGESEKLAKKAGEIPESAERAKLLKRISAISREDDLSKIFDEISACNELIAVQKRGNLRFAVTRLPLTHTPYVPLIPAVIEPSPEKIIARAAINDLKNVSVAITNLTNSLEEYRVELFPGGTYGVEHRGIVSEAGLKFPSDKIRLMRGIRVKDRDSGVPGKLFDPLVDLDISGTLCAASEDSALLWMQFDCKGVKPGRYQGVLRVIPLGDASKLKRDASSPQALNGWVYNGSMLDVPFELEVLPFEISKSFIKPWDVMRIAYDEASFKAMIDQDVRFFIMSCWGISPDYNPDGSVKKFSTELIDQQISDHLKWAEKYGVRDEIKFGLGLGCYQNFMSNFGGKQFKVHSPEWKRAWTNYVKCTADTFKKHNISLNDVYMEIIDEPEIPIRKKQMTYDEIIAVHRIAKECEPEMQVYCWLGAHMPENCFAELIPYVDAWGFVASKLYNPKYKDFIAELRKQGRRIWMYQCNTSMNAGLSSYFRRHAWRAYYTDAELIGFFIYSDPTQGAWAQFSWKKTPGGGVVYRSEKGIMTSIRNECLKLGNQDIKYLDKLKTMLNKKLPDARTVRDAREFLAEAAHRVVISKAHDPNEAEKVRKEAIKHIMLLHEKSSLQQK